MALLKMPPRGTTSSSPLVAKQPRYDTNESHIPYQLKYHSFVFLFKLTNTFPISLLYVQITTFDINAGCPTVIHVVDNVLIPDYKDALLAEAGDIGISILATYDEAGAARPTLPGVVPKP